MNMLNIHVYWYMDDYVRYIYWQMDDCVGCLLTIMLDIQVV